MSELHFAAWGSVDFEKLERIQRRNYLKRARQELKKHGLYIHAGGQKGHPVYNVQVYLHAGDPNNLEMEKIQTYAGEKAFAKACQFAIDLIEGRAQHKLFNPAQPDKSYERSDSELA